MQELGSIEPVRLSEVFEGEASEFTPWLAEQENLDQLGQALNLDLSLVETEGSVGSFRVDVVAKSKSNIVVVENQLNETDHDHLGKLLTYAAGRDARVLVWIAPRLRDEHRAALDWLNRRTPEDLEVYGVEVRAIRIDKSNPALEFHPVIFPDTWSRPNQTGIVMSPEEQKQRFEFFQKLVDEANRRGMRPSPHPATKNKSFRCKNDLLKDGFLRYWVDFTKAQVSVKLDIKTGNPDRNRHIYDALRDQREAIIEELRFEQFEPAFAVSKTAAWAHIRVIRKATALDPPEQLDETRTWILDTLEAFQRVLEPRLAEIIRSIDSEQDEGVLDSLAGDDLD